jgi:hypothetical protein
MLRKGDVVMIQGTVRWDVDKDDTRVHLEIEGAHHVSVNLSIATVFRQEIRLGDRVTRAEPGCAEPGWGAAKVLAVDGDDVFARDDQGRPLLWRRQELIRVDEERNDDNGAD